MCIATTKILSRGSYFWVRLRSYIYIYIYILMYICVRVCVCVCVYLCAWVCVYQPLCRSRIRHKVNFSNEVVQVWIKRFLSPRLVNIKASRLLYYLPIDGGRIVEYILFPKICKMLTTPNRIWTRVAVSISSDDNHYTIYIYVCVCVCVSAFEVANRLEPLCSC